MSTHCHTSPLSQPFTDEESDVTNNLTSSSAVSSQKLTSYYDVYKLTVDVYIVGLLCLFGITGNVASMTVLGRDRLLRRSTGFLLQMLALSDTVYLLACLCYQTLNAVYELTDWLPAEGRQAWSVVMPYTWPCASIAQTCTVWLVVVVTADRYVAICKPLHCQQYSTNFRIRATVVFVWTFSVLYNLPRFFERSTVEQTCPGAPNVTRVIVEHSVLRKHPVYILIYKTGLFFVVRFFVPFAALAFFNTRLIQAIGQSNKIYRKPSTQDWYRRRSSSITAPSVERYTLTLIVVVFVFVLCELPDLQLRLWLALHTYFSETIPFPVEELKYVNRLSNLLLTVNSCVNFLIYCVMGRRFRIIFFQMTCPRGRCGNVGFAGSSATWDGSHRGSSRRGTPDGRLIGVGTSLLVRRHPALNSGQNQTSFVTSIRRSRDVTVHHL